MNILIEKFQETGHHQGCTVTVVYISHELFPINISFKFNKVVNKGLKVNYYLREKEYDLTLANM